MARVFGSRAGSAASGTLNGLDPANGRSAVPTGSGPDGEPEAPVGSVGSVEPEAPAGSVGSVTGANGPPESDTEVDADEVGSLGDDDGDDEDCASAARGGDEHAEEPAATIPAASASASVRTPERRMSHHP